MPEAVIFDLDGVLTDTVEYHYRSWQRLADELQLPFSREANEALRGRSRSDALDLFLNGFEPDLPRAALLERKNDYFLESIEELGSSDLAPGVQRLLSQARARGVRLGLASSSRNARLVCSRLGILGHFDVFADGAAVARPKPAPDIFLWTAGGLGVHPGCCTVVEDSAAGVEAALKAGFRVVGVGDPERVAAAQLRVPDLSEVTLEQLLSPVAAAATGPAGGGRVGAGR